MLCKGHIFAAVAAFSTFATFTGAHAQPGFAGLALRQDNPAMVKVDYYYSGNYGYAADSYYRDYDREGPFVIPFKILGGVAGLFDGVFGAAFDDSSYYLRPCYVSSYDGSPYYSESYNYSSYYYSPYGRSGYYSGSDYGRRSSYSYRAHREYELYTGYDYTYYYDVY
jgi:hypothetical protein